MNGKKGITDQVELKTKEWSVVRRHRDKEAWGGGMGRRHGEEAWGGGMGRRHGEEAWGGAIRK